MHSKALAIAPIIAIAALALTAIGFATLQQQAFAHYGHDHNDHKNRSNKSISEMSVKLKHHPQTKRLPTIQEIILPDGTHIKEIMMDTGFTRFRGVYQSNF